MSFDALVYPSVPIPRIEPLSTAEPADVRTTLVALATCAGTCSHVHEHLNGSAAERFIAKRVKVVGIDSLSVDRDDWATYKPHRRLLSRNVVFF